MGLRLNRRLNGVCWFGLGVLALAGGCGETTNGSGDKVSTTTATTATTATTGGSMSQTSSAGGSTTSGMGGSSTGADAVTQSSSAGGQTSQTASSMTSTVSAGGGPSSGGEAGAPGTTTMGVAGAASCEMSGCVPGGNVGVECGLDEPGVVWVCSSAPWGMGLDLDLCAPMPTQVPRYCCPLDFHPECF